MLPTPDLSHLSKFDYEMVYEPAEDTFILLDALEQEADGLRSLQPLICLEIGSGSGCVSAFLGQILGRSKTLYLTTDINADACSCTRRTGSQNQIPIDAVVADLVSPLRSRLRRSVDVLVFNPPYVPTEEAEAGEAQLRKSISGAWAGGSTGMAITNVLLDQLDDLLSPDGRFYLVAVKENNIPEIQRRMLDSYNLRSEVILQRRAGREHLHIIRFSRSR